MRIEGDLPASPHGKAFYFAVGLFSLVGAFFFISATFAANASIALRVARALITIVYMSAALQALERLFRPEEATRRALALPDPTRRKLRAIRTAVTVLVYAAFVTGAVLHFSVDPKVQDFGTDAFILAGVFVFLALFLADLCGERWPSKN